MRCLMPCLLLSPSPSSSPLVHDATALGGGDDGDGVLGQSPEPEFEPLDVRYAASSPVAFTLNQHSSSTNSARPGPRRMGNTLARGATGSH